LDKLAKPDLPLEAKQKLLENPQLLELSIDPRNGQIDKQSFDWLNYTNSTRNWVYLTMHEP
jgi:hypothetical protein